ncbi:hypothetical protein EX30DRAFT_344087 [Ascodesmis nigricans]|uniref:GCS light chain n=1 Tax=Ascodesmis nigricans TaxID=341454 RepID=A0A4S2MKF1_9PEZI|nr:hypothetical protein EX30DRAFT_344087 [Ascodesmis nigricans]
MPQKCLLKTSNIMTTSSGAGVHRPGHATRSNTELLTALRENIRGVDGEGSTTAKVVLDEVVGEEVLRVPFYDSPPVGLQEEREEYDVTVKLFHLPTTAPVHQPAYTSAAISAVLRELSTPRIDLLIIAFPGITFDADDLPPTPAPEPIVDPATAPAPTAEIAALLPSYNVLESLHQTGVISRLGISEFGTSRLESLLPFTTVKPSVDQINVRDCCVVPKPLIVYAKEKGIELLTHNDCAEVIDGREVEKLFREEGVEGWGEAEDGKKVVPLWVAKYTAVVRSRGVVENKGYIAMVEILP